MPNPNRLQASGKNSTFTPAATYQAYLDQQIAIIQATNFNIHPDIFPTEQVSESNRAVIFIHGLYETPYSMRHLYQHFVGLGFYARNILLPGHGTRPGDLLNTPLSAWLDAVAYAIDTLPPHITDITLVGFSAGAGFALYHTLLGRPINKLILFAPAIKLKNPLTKWARYFNYVKPWYWIGDDDDFAKYQSISFYSIAQMHSFTKQLNKITTPCPCPILMINSLDDEVISAKAAIAYPGSQNIIYTKYPTPKNHVIDFSHCSLTIAPDDPHCGLNGTFKDLQHYQSSFAKFLSRNAPPEIFYGAINHRNLKQYHLARLRVNPEFASLIESIDNFMR